MPIRGVCDYSLSENTKIFGRLAFNRLDEVRGYRYGNAADPSGNVPFVRQNYNGVSGMTHTLNDTTVIDARFGCGAVHVTGRQHSGLQLRPLETGIFGSVSSARRSNHFPQFRFHGLRGTGFARRHESHRLRPSIIS
jgi:hypothetical protein